MQGADNDALTFAIGLLALARRQGNATASGRSFSMTANKIANVRRGRYRLPIHHKNICGLGNPRFDLDHSSKDILYG